MSLFAFPFFRKSIPSVGNPAFVDDILASNQLTIDGLSALTNLPNPGFAIISGLAYTAGAPGLFGPGTFWLNGFFYTFQGAFSEGLYLAPNLVDLENQPFSDTVSRATYTEYFAAPTASSVGATPLFSGNMNQYRIGNNDLNSAILAIQTVLSTLKAAAFLPVGTTAGSVAAGNDSRFGYSTTYQDANFARIVNVLIEGSTNGNFVPTQPYDPATKQYVDQSSAQRLVSGSINVGDIAPGGTTVTVGFGLTLANTDYILIPIVVSQSVSPGTDVVYAPMIINGTKTTTQCQVYFREGGGNTENIRLDWIVFGSLV